MRPVANFAFCVVVMLMHPHYINSCGSVRHRASHRDVTSSRRTSPASEGACGDAVAECQ
jgi:hypothetical protein